MATDHSQHGRRGGHFHNRGRRGPDRRGRDRPQPPAVEQPARGERVDVEQIMREVRARISQRSGVELSNQQIQELAARRLEAILDPRSVKPGLLDQLRRTAGERPSSAEPAPPLPPLFEEVMLYDSPNGFLRFLRKLLNPILRLFFNPTPVAHALAVQGRLHADAATRGAEQERRQAEWNALHYEILQRLVTEIARGSLEAQDITLRVESLSARVDFNDRRARSIEGTPARTPRPSEIATAAPASQPTVVATPAEPVAGSPSEAPQGQADLPRRRRRRRRGRRGTGAGPGAPVEGSANNPMAEVGEPEGDNGGDQQFDEGSISDEPVTETTVAPEVGASPASNVEPRSRELPLDNPEE